MELETNAKRLRKVLAIPLNEVYAQFAENVRQDIKVIVPEILTSRVYTLLQGRGEDAKPEQPLIGRYWEHAAPHEPNRICESSEFINQGLPQYAQGPFALSFANEKAAQDSHYHLRHWEVYYSESPISVEFRYLEETRCRELSLPQGGVMILGPEVVHHIHLGGMTLVIEVPAVSSDKINQVIECVAE